jgi:hypothetical protein
VADASPLNKRAPFLHGFLKDTAMDGVNDGRGHEAGRRAMKTLELQLPMFGSIVATRAALGFGAGLLLSDKMSTQKRRAIGLTLVALGVATTIPAVRTVRSHLHEHSAMRDPSPLE